MVPNHKPTAGEESPFSMAESGGRAWRVLAPRWRLVLAATLLGATIGGVVSSRQPPQYRVVGQVFLDVTSSQDATRLVASEAQVMLSTPVLDRAGTQLHISFADLAGSVTTAPNATGNFFELAAVARTPQAAVARANAVEAAYEAVKAASSSNAQRDLGVRQQALQSQLDGLSSQQQSLSSVEYQVRRESILQQIQQLSTQQLQADTSSQPVALYAAPSVNAQPLGSSRFAVIFGGLFGLLASSAYALLRALRSPQPLTPRRVEEELSGTIIARLPAVPAFGSAVRSRRASRRAYRDGSFSLEAARCARVGNTRTTADVILVLGPPDVNVGSVAGNFAAELATRREEVALAELAGDRNSLRRSLKVERAGHAARTTTSRGKNHGRVGTRGTAGSVGIDEAGGSTSEPEVANGKAPADSSEPAGARADEPLTAPMQLLPRECIVRVQEPPASFRYAPLIEPDAQALAGRREQVAAALRRLSVDHDFVLFVAPQDFSPTDFAAVEGLVDQVLLIVARTSTEADMRRLRVVTAPRRETISLHLVLSEKTQAQSPRGGLLKRPRTEEAAEPDPQRTTEPVAQRVTEPAEDEETEHTLSETLFGP